MDDTTKSRKIAEFASITGIDAERAKFYLESSNYESEVAMNAFYEHGQEPTVQPHSNVSGHGVSGLAPEADSDNEDDENWYVGGSERSGQQVLPPPKAPQRKPKEFIQSLFEDAKKAGAEEVSAAEVAAAGGGRAARLQTFGGAGHRLGDEEIPTETVAAQFDAGRAEVDFVLKLYENGFTVNDEELRDYLAEAEFMNAIKRGEIPRDLVKAARGGKVNLNMEDHRTEQYTPPKSTVKAFTGSGNRLGNPTGPPITSSTANPADASNNETRAQAEVLLSESAPTTTLQIRLSDGARLSGTFNHTHPVSAVRRYITSARPQYAASTFTLMTTFPNRSLTDEDATLKEAGLINAVVVQKMG